MDRSTAQKITLGFGVFYLLIGILGFVPGITVADTSPGAMQGDQLLMGIFGVNLMHNLSHLLFGAILIYGGLTPSATSMANRLMAIVFGLLFVASFIGPIASMVNADPNPADAILHLGSALLTGYLGFVATRRDETVAGRV